MPTDVSIDYDGKTHTGSYRIEEGGFRVTYRGKSKWVHRGQMSNDTPIRLVLAELVGESQRPT
jgi:hypothetical protein